MRSGLFVFVLLIALAVGLPASAQETSDLLGRVNALRASLGIYPYAYQGALAAAAQSQAQWMVDNGAISHTRPDGSGPRSRAAAAGYPSAQVSENIYGGTNASAGDAWVFWMNSGIHYAGLVSTNYNEIGVGAARGPWGAAYVLVFGNSGGPSLASASAAASAPGGASRAGSGGASARSAPSYVVGLDAAGNIQHQVQPGDTLGDIALLYGYTWADLPFMMALNNIADVRDLTVGEIFLVPPAGGTLTPTPDDRSPTPSQTPTPPPATITPFVLPSAAPPVITLGAALALAPTPSGSPAEAALPVAVLEQTLVFTPAPLPSAAATPRPAQPELANAVAADVQQPVNWLTIAVGVQAAVVVGAAFEFGRRALGGRKRMGKR